MQVAIIGLGYVGAVTAACIAQLGHQVVGVDTDEAKAQAIAAGRSPVEEPGLDDLLSAAVDAGRLANGRPRNGRSRVRRCHDRCRHPLRAVRRPGPDRRAQGRRAGRRRATARRPLPHGRGTQHGAPGDHRGAGSAGAASRIGAEGGRGLRAGDEPRVPARRIEHPATSSRPPGQSSGPTTVAPPIR